MKEEEVNLYEIYLNIISFLKKYVIYIVILALIGGALGFFYEKRQSDQHKLSLIIRSELISKKELYVNFTPTMEKKKPIKAKEFYGFISSNMNLSTGVSEIKLDTVTLHDGIVVSQLIQDTSSVRLIKNAFLKYYNTNSNYLSQLNRNRDSKQRELDIIDNEILKIKTYQDKLLKASNSSEIQAGNFAGNSDAILALNKKKEILIQSLSDKEPVTIYQSLATIPSERGKLIYIVFGGFIMGGLGFGIFQWVEFDKRARAKGNEEQKEV